MYASLGKCLYYRPRADGSLPESASRILKALQAAVPERGSGNASANKALHLTEGISAVPPPTSSTPPGN
jgi:hypothetical protein